MAVASTAVLAGIAAAAGIAGSVMSATSKPKAPAPTPAPVYNAKAEQKKAATQEAEANKRRILAETDTVQTTALGNAGTTELKKKTLLGG